MKFALFWRADFFLNTDRKKWYRLVQFQHNRLVWITQLTVIRNRFLNSIHSSSCWKFLKMAWILYRSEQQDNKAITTASESKTIEKLWTNNQITPRSRIQKNTFIIFKIINPYFWCLRTAITVDTCTNIWEFLFEVTRESYVQFALGCEHYLFVTECWVKIKKIE